jgi:hypothetical protein
MGTYFVRDDGTGTTCSFDYSDIVTEGFRTIRTGERSASCPILPTPVTPST